MIKPRMNYWRVLFLADLMAGNNAHAHSPIAGLGNFYGGLLHPFFIAQHVMLLLACALLLGQRGLPALRFGLASFTVFLILGLTFAQSDKQALMTPVILIMAMIGSLLVLVAGRLPIIIYVLFSAATALMIGLDSPQENLVGSDQAIALTGSFVGASLLVLFIASAVDIQDGFWQKIVVRVFASWIAASAMFVLALDLIPVKHAVVAEASNTVIKSSPEDKLLCRMNESQSEINLIVLSGHLTSPIS